MRTVVIFALVVLPQALSSTSSGGTQPPSTAPREATVCELSQKPDAWNHARVRVSGAATSGFEHFVLSDAACGETRDSTRIWLTYGGRVSSGIIYCCPGEGEKAPRPESLVLDDIKLPLVEDGLFRRFRKLMLKEPRAAARVTLVGNFFATEREDPGDPNKWLRGFGHFGLFSLLVIERVERFVEVRPGK